ncbi:MAG TPA: 2-C-methyl-D-erythritol 2,4-cyclodiphosphate synthase [Dictyoglomaceae bacterium]|mgnify:CR=1 FL=1|nr:2-C-methyl-D-erythritol 2,4-cyclodiphosphate synthase [Dictyoglomaceae bacterium]HOL39117.1 2-C-methyl-D-erythritol 2,4-cyclodiphosphate synthase [Dictyoglomaceae bacterium]HOP94274.1 2-C-methyl-D-erythritol 2,4-cyclodiphosphate synthase [Dictyoglomaceae bacterium]HPP15271.1 2-C-methyl-D-erythritol 2,4-cyclodiphosphate synthase [Dictyoglomaceae bacterium]HPU42677.1 2-C-methyl-D-erythritol 2,4-cyclodiphosphate synthase [Dictyoglomaceae bacterium]
MDGMVVAKIRIGFGYDVHPFEEGRELIIGGVKIPYEKGLKGHSDGDVLIHAIVDALLGASSLPDIGYFFPDTEPSLKGISSLYILEKVKNILLEKRVYIINIDSVIVAEEPKILPYRDLIIEKIIATLEIEREKFNVKATTNEKLGFVGRKEGIAAFAVALISYK